MYNQVILLPMILRQILNRSNYYHGIDEAINSIELAAAGEYKERGTQKDNNGEGRVIFYGYYNYYLI